MILKALFTMVGAVAVAATGFAVMTEAAPGAASKIFTLAHDYALGWTSDACETNPLGCLNNRFKSLQDLEKQVQLSIDAVHGQLERIHGLVSEQQDLWSRNENFLIEGRSLYRQRETGGSGPIRFAGKEYPTLDTFKQQLALLFREKTALHESLAKAEGLETKLQERLDSLMVQAGDITLAKRMVPAQIELVKANQTLSQFSSNIETINGVIKGSEEGIADTEQLIRTTKDLMAPEASTPDKAPEVTKDFEDFLKG